MTCKQCKAQYQPKIKGIKYSCSPSCSKYAPLWMHALARLIQFVIVGTVMLLLSIDWLGM